MENNEFYEQVIYDPIRELKDGGLYAIVIPLKMDSWDRINLMRHCRKAIQGRNISIMFIPGSGDMRELSLEGLKHYNKLITDEINRREKIE